MSKVWKTQKVKTEYGEISEHYFLIKSCINHNYFLTWYSGGFFLVKFGLIIFVGLSYLYMISIKLFMTFPRSFYVLCQIQSDFQRS